MELQSGAKKRRSAYYTALAREKYNFYKTNLYLNTDSNGANIDINHYLLEVPNFDNENMKLKPMGLFDEQTKKYEVVYYEIFENGRVDYSKYKILNQETNQLSSAWISI